jgi:hypothetical protein
MKVYLPTIDLNKLNINKINKYLVNSNIKNYILSKNGLYEITSNKVLRLEINDAPIINYNINNSLPVIIDKSISKIEEEFFQIPIDHISDQVLSNEYVLRKGGLLNLIVDIDHKDNKHIRNFYFSALDNIDKKILDEEITSFLKELNLY